MRLLDASTLKLESFDETSTPPYAILSHTWGANEVSFQEIDTPSASLKEGYAKIKFACEEALRRNLGYAWVDTCCIDKTSSAELSEAINSMFKWYAEAKECYVYLADVTSGPKLDKAAFRNSRWFTRGWTLQELLAPKDVYFFGKDRNLIGERKSLCAQICSITNIDSSYLLGHAHIFSASISRRMSWASSRVTTRTEDLAYCLMGLFDINMPLLYGEGPKAFIRLQEEIMKVSDDQSLFAWAPFDQESTLWNASRNHAPFAPNPSFFLKSGEFIPDDMSTSQEEYSITNKGLSITLPVTVHEDGRNFAILACRPRGNLFLLVGIPIHFKDEDSSCVRQTESLILIDRDIANHSQSKRLSFLLRGNNQNILQLLEANHQTSHHAVSVIIRKLPRGIEVENLIVHPTQFWDPSERTILLEKQENNFRVVNICMSANEWWSVYIHPWYHHNRRLRIVRQNARVVLDCAMLNSISVLPPRDDEFSPIIASLGVAFKASPMGHLLVPLDIEDLLAGSHQSNNHKRQEREVNPPSTILQKISNIYDWRSY